MTDDQQFTFEIPFPEKLPRLIGLRGMIPEQGGAYYDQIDSFFCYLETLRDSGDPIKLIIESTGGDGYTMTLIQKQIDLASSHIYTITRRAYSAAALIFIGGTKGNRYVFEDSRLMLHAAKVSYPCPGHRHKLIFKKYCSDYSSDLENLAQGNRTIAQFLLYHTEGKILNFLGDWSNVSDEEERIQGVLTLLNRDEWFDAEEAIEYGLADQIIDEEIEKKLFSGIIP